MTALTAPQGLIVIGGKTLPRRRGFAHRSEAVTCVNGHVIEDRAYLHDGWSTPPCPECDMAVVIMAAYNGFQFRADLTGEEASEISARGWRLGEVLRYTGASLDMRTGMPAPDGGRPPPLAMRRRTG